MHHILSHIGVMSCRVISSYILSYHIWPYNVMSYHIISYHVIFLCKKILSCLWCLDLSYLVILYHVLLCNIILYLVISCDVLILFETKRTLDFIVAILLSKSKQVVIGQITMRSNHILWDFGCNWWIGVNCRSEKLFSGFFTLMPLKI